MGASLPLVVSVNERAAGQVRAMSELCTSKHTWEGKALRNYNTQTEKAQRQGADVELISRAACVLCAVCTSLGAES